MKQVEIYADGACRGNGKEKNIGGYGVILKYKEHTKELKASFQNTTNNKMELMSVIEGLQALKEPCSVTIYSDSAYIVNAINQKWLEGWIKRGWVTSTKEKVKNIELWKELKYLIDIHKVVFVKVKGHSDNELNNRADQLANEAMDEPFKDRNE